MFFSRSVKRKSYSGYSKTKPKGNVQLDSPDSCCAMNKYYNELYEHKAIDELAFREFA